MGVFDEIAAEAIEVSGVASDASIKSLGEKAAEYVAKEAKKEALEKELKELNGEISELKHKILPDIMLELDVDKYGLASAGVDIKLSDYAKANISAEWEPAKQEAAFAHLEELGVDSIIRTQVTFSFGKDQFAHAQTVVAMLNLMAERIEEFGGTEIPVPTIKKSVPWNTLTATLKELHKKGIAVDLEKIGGVLGHIVKIEKRK